MQATVTNGGTKQARANCRVTEFQGSYAGAANSVLTDLIPSKGTVTFRDVLHGVAAAPRGTRVLVSCN